ncbi:MAG: hypothetical protein V3V10_07220 [Planctomycetota bacterium]
MGKKKSTKNTGGFGGVDMGDSVKGVMTSGRKLVMAFGLALAAVGVAVAVLEPRKNEESGRLGYDIKLPIAAGLLAWAPVEFVLHNMLNVRKIPKEVARSAAVMAGLLAASYETILLPLIMRDPDNIVTKVFQFGYNMFGNEDKKALQAQLAAQSPANSTSGAGIFGVSAGVSNGGGNIDSFNSNAGNQSIGVQQPQQQQPQRQQPQQSSGFDFGGLIAGLGSGFASVVGAFKDDEPAGTPAAEDEF